MSGDTPIIWMRNLGSQFLGGSTIFAPLPPKKTFTIFFHFLPLHALLDRFYNLNTNLLPYITCWYLLLGVIFIVLNLIENN